MPGPPVLCVHLPRPRVSTLWVLSSRCLLLLVMLVVMLLALLLVLLC